LRTALGKEELYEGQGKGRVDDEAAAEPIARPKYLYI